MLKHLLLTLLFLAGVALHAQSPGTLNSVYFDTDRSELSPEAQKTLDAVMPQLLQSADYHIDIEAYADDRGTVEYNRRLAARRAEAVKTYLAGKGVMADNSTVTNWGEGKSDDASEAGRQRNRRVDLRLNPIFFNSVSEVQQRLSVNTAQVLQVPSTKETEFVAAKGTLVRVPAGAFVFEDGTAPSGNIELSIKEALSPADFILYNLNTVSGDRLLQSGGMVCIEASSGGKPLHLAEGQSIAISLSNTSGFDPEMSLFYAEKNAAGNLDWVPGGQKLVKGYGTLAGVEIPVDRSLTRRIATLPVEEIPEPVAPQFSDNIPIKPKPPRAPVQPRHPRKPDWEEVRKNFGVGVEQEQNPKKLKKAREYYRERLEVYARDSANYVLLEEQFQQKQKNYEEAQVNYEQQFKDWKSEFARRMIACHEFERKMQRHLFSICLSNALKIKAATLKKITPSTDLYTDVAISAGNRYLQISMGTNSAIELNKKWRQSETLLRRALGPDAHLSENLRDCPEAFHYDAQTFEDWTNDMINQTGIRDLQKEIDLIIEAKRKTLPVVSTMVDQRLNDYVARVTKTGWINCDRYINAPPEKLEVVQAQESENTCVYVVGLSDKVMINCLRNPMGVFVSPSMPKGMQVAVIAVKVEDGKVQYARSDLKVGAPMLPPMAYKTLTLNEMKAELQKLNG